jgi:hypothetical protein
MGGLTRVNASGHSAARIESSALRYVPPPRQTVREDQSYHQPLFPGRYSRGKCNPTLAYYTYPSWRHVVFPLPRARALRLHRHVRRLGVPISLVSYLQCVVKGGGANSVETTRSLCSFLSCEIAQPVVFSFRFSALIMIEICASSVHIRCCEIARLGGWMTYFEPRLWPWHMNSTTS